MTKDEAQTIARRYFNEADADWNILGALAATGEVTDQTYKALSDFHGNAHGQPMHCVAALPGHLCDLLRLREWAAAEGPDDGEGWRY